MCVFVMRKAWWARRSSLSYSVELSLLGADVIYKRLLSSLGSHSVPGTSLGEGQAWERVALFILAVAKQRLGELELFHQSHMMGKCSWQKLTA